MSIKSLLIKNTGFNLAGYFYLLVASFFSVSIILGNLGRETFGVYVFLASFISISSVFDFGVSTAVIRKLSLPDIENKDRISVWKTSFAIFISLALLVSAVVTGVLYYLTRTLPLFSGIDAQTINLTVAVLSAIIFINHLNIHFLSLPQAEQRFDIFNSKTFLVGTANTVLSAFVSSYYHNIAAIFLVQFIFHIFTFIYLIRYSQKIFTGVNFFPRYDRQTGKDLFSFGIRNFIGTLAGQVEAQYSNFILGTMVSASAITSFNIPQNIVMKGAGVVSQFAQAFFPLSASLLTKDRILKLKKLFLVVEGLTLLGGALAVTLSYTIGYNFLLWWLKDPIVAQNAAPILKILSWYFVLVSLTPVPTALLQGLNKPQIPSFFGIFTVSLEIIFSLLLISSYGPLGVAYAFFISVAVTVPLILLVTWKQLNNEINRLNGVSSPQ